MVYATIEDVQRAWRDVAEFEKARFGQILEDAGLWLDLQVEAGGGPVPSASVLRFLSCNLLRRAVGELDPTGADAQWATYTDQAAQYNAPAAVRSDFYLTRWERAMLGIGQGRAGFAAGAGDDDER